MLCTTFSLQSCMKFKMKEICEKRVKLFSLGLVSLSLLRCHAALKHSTVCSLDAQKLRTENWWASNLDQNYFILSLSTIFGCIPVSCTLLFYVIISWLNYILFGKAQHDVNGIQFENMKTTWSYQWNWWYWKTSLLLL